MFIAYIYIPFNQNLDKKSYKNAKKEAVKHLHAVFLLTAEQRRRQIRLQKAMVYFFVIEVVWLDVVMKCKLHYIPMFTTGLNFQYIH